MRQNGLAGVSSAGQGLKRLGGVPTPPQGAYLKGHAVQVGACITTTPTQVLQRTKGGFTRCGVAVGL